jgi:hypothetical protein
MKKFYLILAALPVTALLLFKVLNAPNTASKQSVAPASVKSQNQGLTSKALLSSGDNGQVFEERTKNLLAKIVEVESKMADHAKQFNTGMITDATDRLVAARESQYRALFKEWSLEEQQAQKVLGVLRERRDNLTKNMLRQMKETPTEVGDRSDPVANRKSIEKVMSLQKDTEWQAEMQLLPILGAENYAKLMALDKQIDQQEVAKNDTDKAD